MTTFGKILIGLMLATAAVLIIKGGTKSSEPVMVEEVQDDGTTPTPSDTATDGKFNGSVNELIARGGDYECTFSHSTDAAYSTGTVFVSGKKMRGDFNSTTKLAANIKMESHMISDGEFLYNWSSAMPTGFKMAIAESSNATSTAGSQALDYNQKLDYDCKAWTADASKFVIPAEIKFTTL